MIPLNPRGRPADSRPQWTRTKRIQLNEGSADWAAHAEGRNATFKLTEKPSALQKIEDLLD